MVALGVAAAGCDRHHVELGGAEVCVIGDHVTTTGENGPAEVAEGDILTLVAMSTFGCHTAEHEITCDVREVAPGDLVVTTRTTWLEVEPLSFSCESVMRWVTGICQTLPLSSGPARLSYEGDELLFDVPGAAEGCVAD